MSTSKSDQISEGFKADELFEDVRSDGNKSDITEITDPKEILNDKNETTIRTQIKEPQIEESTNNKKTADNNRLSPDKIATASLSYPNIPTHGSNIAAMLECPYDDVRHFDSLMPLEGCKMIEDILSSSHTYTLYGVSISNDQALIAVTAFACELLAQNKPVSVSPHVIMTGLPKSGKSLLSKLLTDENNSSFIPVDKINDINSYALDKNQKCFIVDRVQSNNYFLNEDIKMLVRKSFHQSFVLVRNNVQKKFKASGFLIITANLDRSDFDDAFRQIPWKKRFLKIRFNKNFLPLSDYFNFDMRVEIVVELAKHVSVKFAKNSGFNVVDSSATTVEIQRVKDELAGMLELVQKFSYQQ